MTVQIYSLKTVQIYSLKTVTVSLLLLSSPKGRTPLSCAAEAGKYDIVSYLLACRNTTDDGRVITTSPEGSGVSEVRTIE